MAATEVPGMEETTKSESHLTSAAAFVEGGIQEACDDACSICLEAFCESDPSTLTSCLHEFHLQCILEWCQRSSQCPMCWQPISLKDPTSQELLEAVERERSFRFNPARNATIFHHPTLGDFELQHLPVGANDAEFEERIIQHLAAAAAMGRARHLARREGQRNRPSAHARPQFLVFSTHPSTPYAGPASSSPAQREGEQAPAVTVAPLSSPLTTVREESSPLTASVPPAHTDQISALTSGSSILGANQHGFPLNNRRSPSRSSPSSQDRGGPSDFQTFSESLKSRVSALSVRYKDSISKSTRGWKERLFSRNTSTADIGSDARREVNVGIAAVSQMMEHLETRDTSRANAASIPNSLEDSSVPESNIQQRSEIGGNNPLSDTNTQTSYAAGSASN